RAAHVGSCGAGHRVHARAHLSRATVPVADRDALALRVRGSPRAGAAGTAHTSLAAKRCREDHACRASGPRSAVAAVRRIATYLRYADRGRAGRLAGAGGLCGSRASGFGYHAVEGADAHGLVAPSV